VSAGEGTVLERAVGSAMGWSVAVRVVRFGVGLASSVLVVRSLGPGDYGVLSVLRMILAFVVAIASFGLAQALLRFVPELKKDPPGARRLVTRTAAMQLFPWAAALAASVVASGWLSRVLGADLRPFLALGVLLTLAELIAMLLGNALTAYYDVKTQTLAALLSSVLFLGTLVVLLDRGGGILAVLVATGVGHLGTSVALLPALAGRLRARGAAAGGDASSGVPWRRVFRYALPFGLISVLNLVTWRQSETLILSHFWSPREVGFFDLAYKLPQLVLEFIPLAVWPLVLASYSEVYSREPAKAAAVVDRYYRLLFVLGAPVSLFGATVAGAAIPLLYGEAFRPAAPLCTAFFLLFPLTFLGTPLSMSLYVLEKTGTILLVYLGASVVNVGLDLLLIPRNWQIGSVVPTTLVVALTPLAYARILKVRGFGYRVPWRFIGRAYLASAACLALWPLGRWVRTLPALAVFGAAGFAVILLGVRWVRLVGPEEAEFVRRSRLPMARTLLAILGAEAKT
jgi:O-antigen/teichoic acid export membrane protein